MCDLIFEYGMLTVSWYAELAFRRRVSMSAIGSVIVMANRPSSPWFPVVPFVPSGPAVCSLWFGSYQLDLVRPGSSPRGAMVRKQIRHRLKRGYTARGRPQRVQRV